MEGKKEREGKSTDRHPLDESKHDKPKSILGKRKPTYLTRKLQKKMREEAEEDRKSEQPKKNRWLERWGSLGRHKKHSIPSRQLDVSEPTRVYQNEMDFMLDNYSTHIPFQMITGTHGRHGNFKPLYFAEDVIPNHMVNEIKVEEDFAELKEDADEPVYIGVPDKPFWKKHDLEKLEAGIKSHQEENPRPRLEDYHGLLRKREIGQASRHKMKENLPLRKWAATRPHLPSDRKYFEESMRREDRSEELSEALPDTQILDIWTPYTNPNGTTPYTHATSMPWVNRQLRSDIHYEPGQNMIQIPFPPAGQLGRINYLRPPAFPEFGQRLGYHNTPELFPDRWFNYKGIPGHH